MGEEFNYEEAAKKDLQKRESESGLFEDKSPISLGKSSEWQKDKVEGDGIRLGWHNIPVSIFPSKGLFYPQDIRVQIRAASVKEIRQFSVVSDDDPFSIDEGMNHIMGSCVNVNIPGKISNWKDILEEDRIHIILAVKELTFKQGENRMEIPYECVDCGYEGRIEFKNENLKPNEIKDDIMKYFDPESRIFRIKTKSSGTFNLRPPSIGVMKIITEWIKENTQTEFQRKKIDQGFIKCLPFLVHDWRGFKKENIKNIQVEFMGWDATKYSTFFHVVDMIKVGVDSNCHSMCTNCGSEVHAPIQFPRGIKSLFVISDITQELL